MIHRFEYDTDEKNIRISTMIFIVRTYCVLLNLTMAMTVGDCFIKPAQKALWAFVERLRIPKRYDYVD